MQKIFHEYMSLLGYAQASPAAKKTFWGVILVKFGTAIIGAWGVISIYFYSYFKLLDPTLLMSEFNFLVTIAAIPMCIIALFSIRIGRRFGFSKLIRISMIISPVSMIIGSLQKTFHMFAIFNSFISSLCFGSTLMPILYCAWSHFPEKTGNMTGIAFASFGIATFCFCIIATLFVNPENLSAIVVYKEQQQVSSQETTINLMKMKFKFHTFDSLNLVIFFSHSILMKTYYLFEEEVAIHVPKMALLLGTLQLLFCVPGAFLISEIPLEDKKKVVPADQPIEMDFIAKQGDDNLNETLITRQEPIVNEAQVIEEVKPTTTFSDALKSGPFILIYFSTFLLSCFSVFISFNFKTYGLTKINDDHFLTFIVTLCTVLSSLSNLVWGYLIDRYSFKTVYLSVVIVILVAGFCFPYLTTTKFGFFIIFQALSASERGLYTIIGPGLVQIFGIKIGAEVFPIKMTSYFLALVLLPVFQMILLKSYNYDTTTHIFMIGVLVAFGMACLLKHKYNYY